MKKPWDIKTLGELCSFENGDRGENYPSKAVQTSSGVPFINAGHLAETGIDFSEMNYIPRERFELLGNGKIRKNDVLFCLRGSLGKFASVGELNEGAIASSLVIIRPSAALLNEFLLAYLQSDLSAAMIHKFKNGAAQPNLAAASLKKFEIPVPPLAEQQRIVGVLDEAFAGLATAQAHAAQNLQNARALFESHLQSVFTHRGPGWVETTLGDENLLQIIDGDRGVNYPKASDFHDEGHCLFLNTKNVRPDGFDFDSMMFISAEKDGQLRKGKLKRDDVVLTTRGTIGNLGLYSEDVPYEHIRINSGMLIFRPNKRVLLPTYLFELLRSDIVKDQIRKQTTGAAQPQLPIKTLVNFVIPLPTSLDDQLSIVKKLRAFEPETQRLTRLYEQKQAALAALKKSLLHQAFSGEL